MARNIVIQTLNSIRSALMPKGRDVAEAFDAVDVSVGQLQKQITALANKPVPAPTVIKQIVQSPSTLGGGSGSAPSTPYVPPGTSDIYLTWFFN